MYFNILDDNSRRILIDASQLYQTYLQVSREYSKYRGGMKWITRNGKEYLFRQRNSRGDGNSLGVRNEHNEESYARFHTRKSELAEKQRSLRAELKQQSGFCVAANINRVPKIAADIVRVIHQAKSNSSALIVVGTNALFAYETMAGVRFDTEILTTMDMDLMWDVDSKLILAGRKSNEGLISLLKKADRTFERLSEATYRATNQKGYLVDLIKSVPSPVHKITPSTVSGDENDLIAAEIEYLNWLYAVPPVSSVVIGNDGFPVIFDVPDPRVFAAHKLWLSEQPSRDPVKKARDRKQGFAVLHLLKAYLHEYPLDEKALRGLPQKLRDKMSSVYDNIVVGQPSPPVPGF